VYSITENYFYFFLVFLYSKKKQKKTCSFIKNKNKILNKKKMKHIKNITIFIQKIKIIVYNSHFNILYIL
jgi:hypothetical protein